MSLPVSISICISRPLFHRRGTSHIGRNCAQPPKHSGFSPKRLGKSDATVEEKPYFLAGNGQVNGLGLVLPCQLQQQPRLFLNPSHRFALVVKRAVPPGAIGQCIHFALTSSCITSNRCLNVSAKRSRSCGSAASSSWRISWGSNMRGPRAARACRRVLRLGRSNPVPNLHGRSISPSVSQNRKSIRARLMSPAKATGPRPLAKADLSLRKSSGVKSATARCLPSTSRMRLQVSWYCIQVQERISPESRRSALAERNLLAASARVARETARMAKSQQNTGRKRPACLAWVTVP